MLDLELATTEQILEELGRRPIQFVHVCTFDRMGKPSDGYIAFSSDLDEQGAIRVLQKAQELLAQPCDE